MTAEREILAGLLASVRELVRSGRETLQFLTELPADADAFATLPVMARVASTAALKHFEQSIIAKNLLEGDVQ